MWWFACSPGDTVEAPEAASIADLWDGVASSGAHVSVPARVTSPRTADDESFYVQDPAGGPGLRVGLRGDFPTLPPSIGTEIEVGGIFTLDEDGPAVLVDALEDVVVSDVVSEPVIAEWPEAPGLGLVRAAVVITSPPDPLFEASTDQFPLDGSFRTPVPAWHSRAFVIGVWVGAALAPRTVADWAVTAAGEAPLEVPLSDIGGLGDGAWVRVRGAQATPWSTDGRFVLVQDESGHGSWVDTEAFAVARTSVPGDLLEIVAETRERTLRCWTTPEIVGTAAVIVIGDGVDGTLATGTLTPAGDPDAWGAVPSLEGPRIGHRFVEPGSDAITGSFALSSDPDGLVWNPF